MDIFLPAGVGAKLTSIVEHRQRGATIAGLQAQELCARRLDVFVRTRLRGRLQSFRCGVIGADDECERTGQPPHHRRVEFEVFVCHLIYWNLPPRCKTSIL